MNPKSILLVDDEAFMRRIMEATLRKGGFVLTQATDGQSAVESVARQRPDLIVMDVSMPRLDGLGALRQIKGDPATAAIPVIMLTARGHVLTRQEAEESGADLFLTKPFSPSQLLVEACRLLGIDPP